MLNKKVIISPTMEQLKEILNLINWDLKHVGCGWYRIYNHNGNPTIFEIYKDSEELRDGDRKSIFGDKYCGCLHINISYIVLTYFDDEKLPFISISPKGCDPDKFFMSFYNHEFKDKEKEK